MTGYIVETSELFGTLEVGRTYNRRRFTVYGKVDDAVDDYDPKFYRIYEVHISGNELKITKELFREEKEKKIQMRESDYRKLNQILEAETDEEVLAALK